MRKAYSNPPPESTRLPDSSEKMPDFNNLFQESVPKMMRVTDDLHQMILLQSTNIRDLQNMMIGLLTIIGILIFFILKYRNGKQKQKRRRRSNRGKYRFNGIRSENSFIGNRYMNKNCDAFMSEVHLFDDVLICGECRFRTNDINKFADHKSRKCSNITKAPSEPKSIQCCKNTFKSSWKLLQHLTDKHNLNLYRDESTADDSQERCGPKPPSPLPSESVKSEENHPTTLIMNDDYTCIPNLQLNIPMPTTPTSMPYYSDSTGAAEYGTPPLTNSVSDAATPSVSSLIDSKNPSMFKARVFVGNLKKTRVSREDLVGLFEGFGNVLGATLFEEHAFVQFSKQSEAELCVQTLNGYTWEGSELVVKILTLYSKNDAIDRSNVSQNFSNISNKRSGVFLNIGNAGRDNKQSVKQTIFNQNTTNFIVCFSDSSKSLNV